MLMSAYAIAHLRNMSVNREVVVYLKKIDSTLEPYKGRFLVHGKKAEVVEGEFEGYIIIIEFPDIEHARGWYHSDAYQQIVPLRSNNSKGYVILVDGVSEHYKASSLLD